MSEPAPAASPAPSGLLGQLWTRAEGRPHLAIILVCLIALIPGFFTTPPLDRDESRYVQASRQMIETGDFVEIRFQEDARNKKPAGIYWMQTVTASIFGGADAPVWAYRIPSLLAAIGAALATFWAGCALFDRRIALLGALMAGVSLSAVVEGHIAKTDAMLLFTIVLSQGVLARAYLAQRRGDPAPGWGLTTLFWVAQGIGILVKGPITPMVSGLTFLMLAAWDRNIKWGALMRPLTGLLIAALITLPWLIAIWIATDGAFFAEAVGTDMLGKIGEGQERHGGPPGYHLLLVSAMFWPASLFLFPAIRNAWAGRASDAVRFCIAWIVPTWLVFEITSTKLPHYVLPTYPALALLVAFFVLSADRIEAKVLTRIGIVIWTLVTILLAVAAFVVPHYYGDGIAWGIAPLSALILLGVGRTLLTAWRGEHFDASLQGLLVGILTMATVFQLTLPSLTDLAMSPRLAAAVERAQGEDGPPTTSSGFTEPSLVFLLGTDTNLTTPEGAADHLAQHPGGIALIEAEMNGRDRGFNERFLNRILDLELAVELVEEVEGYNYSGGDEITILVYREGGAQ